MESATSRVSVVNNNNGLALEQYRYVRSLMPAAPPHSFKSLHMIDESGTGGGSSFQCSLRLRLDTQESFVKWVKTFGANSETEWREEVGGKESAMTFRCVELQCCATIQMQLVEDEEDVKYGYPCAVSIQFMHNHDCIGGEGGGGSELPDNSLFPALAESFLQQRLEDCSQHMSSVQPDKQDLGRRLNEAMQTIKRLLKDEKACGAVEHFVVTVERLYKDGELETVLRAFGKVQPPRLSRKKKKSAEPPQSTAASPGKRRKRSRCGACEGCANRDKTQDCRQCRNCLDQKRYGGPGRLKKACLKRSCIIMSSPEMEAMDAAVGQTAIAAAAAAPASSYVSAPTMPMTMSDQSPAAVLSWPGGPEYAPTFEVNQPIHFSFEPAENSTTSSANDYSSALHLDMIAEEAARHHGIN